MRIQASTDINRVDAEDVPRYVAIVLGQIVSALNNGLSFVDNFQGEIASMTFTAANADTSIENPIGRVPSGYLVLSRSASMIVYDGSVASTASTLTLRASATGTVSLLVF